MYQPLARKYRPLQFKDLVGQDILVRALLNAKRLKREPASVIFSGTRGVGKTTSARIYAKALNCTSPDTDFDACARCDNCLAVQAGTHEDVVEIDGASNNSVDEVRRLRETVSFLPQRGAYKVYLIDEVHMLSTAAFNALLKTLEEPPPNVVFLFATTELHKVPKTVKGRCQCFHLQNIATDLIYERIQSVCEHEKIEFETAALRYIAKQGKGSLRDALTALDQMIAIGGGAVTQSVLREVMVVFDDHSFSELAAALLERDGPRCLKWVEGVDTQGVDYSELVSEFAYFLHRVSVAGVSPREENQELLKLHEAARPLDSQRLFRTFLRCQAELSGSGLDRCVFENYCLEWCLDPGLPTARDVLEDARPIKSPAQVGAPRLQDALEQPKRPVQSTPVQASQPKPTVASSGTPRFPADWRGLLEVWQRKRPLRARSFEEASPLAYTPELIHLALDPSSAIGAELLRNPDRQKALQKELFELVGFSGLIKVSQLGASDQDHSVRTEKVREKREMAQKEIDAAKNHPLTRVVAEEFGGTMQVLDQPPH